MFTSVGAASGAVSGAMLASKLREPPPRRPRWKTTLLSMSIAAAVGAAGGLVADAASGSIGHDVQSGHSMAMFGAVGGATGALVATISTTREPSRILPAPQHFPKCEKPAASSSICSPRRTRTPAPRTTVPMRVNGRLPARRATCRSRPRRRGGTVNSSS
jgi:hypothetical protein